MYACGGGGSKLLGAAGDYEYRSTAGREIPDRHDNHDADKKTNVMEYVE